MIFQKWNKKGGGGYVASLKDMIAVDGSNRLFKQYLKQSHNYK